MVDGYGVVARFNFEWLNEGLMIRHGVKGLSRPYDTLGFYRFQNASARSVIGFLLPGEVGEPGKVIRIDTLLPDD